MPLRPRRWIAALISVGALAAPAFGQVSVPPGGAAALSAGGALDLGCTDLNASGSVMVGAGQLTRGATVNIGATGVLNGGQGFISVGAGWINSGSFIAGTSTVVLGDACASGPFQFGGSTVFYNLTLTSATGRTFTIPAGAHLVVLGTLTLQGVPGNPLQLVSSVSGTTASITLGNGAQVVASNAVVGQDVQIGAPVNAIPALGELGLAVLVLLMLLSTQSQSIQGLARQRAGKGKQ